MAIQALTKKKKGLISLETLIIFIAVILIAALSAGVLIRNSGVLSQRALSVGEESRERLISGVEIMSMTGTADIDAETINDIEILLRLKPGSLPVQLRNLRVLFSTNDISTAATMQIEGASDTVFDDVDMSFVDDTWQSLGIDIEDSSYEIGTTTEQVRLYNDSGTWYLQFNLSYSSNNADPDTEEAGSLAIIPLGVTALTGSTLTLTDEPVEVNEMVYGYVNVADTFTVDGAFTGMTITLSNFPVSTFCRHDNLIPERRFCLEDSIGNGDTTLGNGEIIKLKYKFRTQTALGLQSYYDLQLIPTDGAIEKLQANTPSTVVVERVTLWG